MRTDCEHGYEGCRAALEEEASQRRRARLCKTESEPGRRACEFFWLRALCCYSHGLPQRNRRGKLTREGMVVPLRADRRHRGPPPRPRLAAGARGPSRTRRTAQ